MDAGEMVKTEGMGIWMTAIFIAGQMAGGGVLMLPGALVNTGPWGLLLLAYFTVNGAYVGTRLGHCWIMVEEQFPEMRREKCRDPYPTIAEKAVGKVGRYFATVCIMGVQYGTGIGFIVLTAKFMDNIFHYIFPDDLVMSTCRWMPVMFVIIAPTCWFGSPHDFWWLAPTALTATATACVAIMVRESIDAHDSDSCYGFPGLTNTTPTVPPHEFDPVFPPPEDFNGFGEAFSLIMFAFAGSASFPTYQSDMKDRRLFPRAVLIAFCALLVLYVPMTAVGYFELGEMARQDGGIVCALCDGGVKLMVEILLLVHLISAYPMFLNPPNQFLEKMIGLPPGFTIKRTVFRTLIIAFLLFLAESLPTFSGILQLISSVFVTSLTFVFPPLFYMRLTSKAKYAKEGNDRKLGILEIVLCSQAIVIGVCGGAVSFYTAIKYIQEMEFIPCYVEEMARSC